MLSKNCMSVYDVLKRLSANGGYKVVTVGEILNSLNKSFTTASVKQHMETLAREGYINIKFSEDETYCYTITKVNKNEDDIKDTHHSHSNTLNYLFVALASFIGSMVALFVFFLIFG